MYVHKTEVFVLSRIFQSRLNLSLINFGPTNKLITSLFNISNSTVSLQDIYICGPFNNNISLIELYSSTTIVSQLTATHLTSSLLSSYTSYITFIDLIIDNSAADWLVVLYSSHSSLLNASISSFYSPSGNSTIYATSSTITCDNLLLDQYTSSSFLILCNSSGSLFNFRLIEVQSSTSLVQLFNSTIQIDNVASVNIDLFLLIKLDLSHLYCQSLSFVGSQINSVILSHNSHVFLSDLLFENVSIEDTFAMVTNSVLNTMSLSFVNSKLAAVIKSYGSVVDLNLVDLQSVSFIISILPSSVFIASNSRIVLSNFYADVMDITMINSTDSTISCLHVEISSSNADILYYIASSSFTILDSEFFNVSTVFLHSFNSVSILHRVHILNTTSSLKNYLAANTFDINSSNLTTTQLSVNHIKCYNFFHSTNSSLTLEGGNFSNLLSNSVFNCTKTFLQSNTVSFMYLTLSDTFMTVNDSSFLYPYGL
ncbi:hypothetical protein GEMRC1_005339 [Eukaryota sp. GEM-RC1]